MSEAWKPIPFRPDVLISNRGRIVTQKGVTRGDKSNRGYLMITLAVNKKCKAFSVHRLVLLTFIGESELHVNHKNGVKTDNRLGNLEYVSRSENAQHAMRTGLWVPHKGSKNGRAKVTEDQVREIRTMLAKGQMSKTIAERLGIKVNIVQRIKTGRSWVHVTDEL